MIMPDIVGDDHKLPREKHGIPFAVGSVSKNKSFIHVLDDTSLDLLLKHLDTVSDFVGYLRKKESFILSGRLGMAAGEEALLGQYVSRVNADDEHDFVIPETAGDHRGALGEQKWFDFLKSGERRRQLEADEVSYAWDAIIEQFTDHYMAGTSHHLTEGKSSTYGFEKVLRFFARESRLRRRVLATSLRDMHRTTPPHQRRLRVVPPMRTGEPHWVLLLFPFPQNLGFSFTPRYEEYRAVRREFLNCCMRVVKLENPDAIDIVGFGTESGRREIGSEDAAYLDARVWSDADQRDAAEVKQRMQILTSASMVRTSVAEYPSDETGKEQHHR